MSDQDVKQLIVTYLDRVQLSREHETSDEEIKSETIQIIRERRIPGYRLTMFEYDGPDDEQLVDTILIGEEAQGALRLLSSGTSSLKTNNVPIIYSRTQRHDPPFMRLSWENRSNGPFWARGTVIDTGFETVKTRLIDAQNSVITSDIQNRIALFLTPSPLQTPFTIELYNRNGEIVSIEVIS